MIIIKIGGSAIGNLENLLADMPERDMIIVHGGGREVTRFAEILGKEQKFIISPSGYRSRYTDKEMIEIFQMVIFKINKDVVRILSKFGRKAIGLCGMDNCIVRAKRKEKLIAVENGRKVLVEGGCTGKITKVNTNFIQRLLQEGIIPVIGSLAIGENFEPLNIDGDSLATFVASSLGADLLVFFTDKDGILDENGSTISRLKFPDLANLKTGFGMNRKILEVSKLNIKRIIIANGLKRNPFTQISGTVIENE